MIREENEKTAEFMSRMRKTTNDIRSKKNLITDMETIAKGARTPEGELDNSLKNKIIAIKEKYGIKSWPPQKDAIKLEIQTLQEELESLQTSIGKAETFPLKEELTKLQSDQKRADEILVSMGHEDPSSLKKNVRKNILRKYLWKQAELEKDLGSLQISETA